MKIATKKWIQGMMSSMVAIVLCCSMFIPAAAFGVVLSDKPDVYQKKSSGVQERIPLPAYALLPDGSPNPAFVDEEGNLFTVSPEEFEKILANWENPVIDTEGLPTVEELLGFIPVDPKPVSEIESPEIQGGDSALSSEGGQDAELFTVGMESILMETRAEAVDYPYFFHLSGQNDPYGSGHTYRQYYVPAGSTVPWLSFCLEMGKNAPPSGVKVAYSQVAAPDWSTALATFAPAVLKAHGIETTSDNEYRHWAMQDAVWALQGANIGAAAVVPVIQSLVAAARNPVTMSIPKVSGITEKQVLKAEFFGEDKIRYGPFSLSGMSGNASISITTADGKGYSPAWLGDAAGNVRSQSAVSNNTNYYIYIPRNLYLGQRISIRIEAPYILPTTMNAFQAPTTNYQNQIVMPSWTPHSGTLVINANLGGYGKFEFTKLDTGWKPEYSENPYMLEGAVFKLQEWKASGFVDSPVPVVYDAETRTYLCGYLFETNSNNGLFRIVETTVPDGYRDPVSVEFNLRAKYELRLNSFPENWDLNINEVIAAENKDGDGTIYVPNNLLNVEIKIQKRDKAETQTGTAIPQGGASLAGAYYGLYYNEAVTDPSGISHEAEELVCIGITDEDGKIVFDNSDADKEQKDNHLIWNNDDTSTNYGTEDYPIYLPVFERKDKRIYPAKYYVQELVPSPGYFLDIDPDTAVLDSNGVPLPGTGTARKYFVDAGDNGSATNPVGIRIDTTVTEQVKMRGFLLRKIRSDGYETEVYDLNGAGFSVYLISDLLDIIKKAAESDPKINIPQRGPGGWNKQDFIDFFYDPDYIHPIDTSSGKDWYNHDTNLYNGRYDFDLYPELLRARIDYLESPVFYSGADLIPGLRYGKYGNTTIPNDGEVVFPEFPYGEYIVFETYTPPGVDHIKPFVVNIAEDGNDIIDGDGVYQAERPEQSWRIQIDSSMFSIRLWKKDAETGKTVISKDAAFRILYLGVDGVEGGLDDKWVEMTYPGPNGIERFGTIQNPFRVGEDGILILPRKLTAGSYKLYEVEAPDGYVLSYHEADDGFEYYYAKKDQIHYHGYGEDEKAGDANYVEGHAFIYAAEYMTENLQPDIGIVFDVNEAHRVQDFDIDSDGYDDFVLELVQYNEQKKGRINIHKTKEEGDTITAFAGVRFELYAAEDIISLDGHGSLIYKSGDLVAGTETNSSGNAYFKNLYLGKYLLKEADIPDSSKITAGGKLVSGYKFVDQIVVDLTAPDGAVLDKDSPFYQENPVISVSYDMLNVLELGRIEVHKVGEKPGEAYFDSKTGTLVVPYDDEPLAGITFEVVCAKDIGDINTSEIVWKKGDIVGAFTTDENGIGSLGDLLPGDYILREVSAPEGYILMKDRPFTINEREHIDPFEWYTWDITDVRQKLSIEIEKIDDTDSRVLAGAVFGLYAAEDMDFGIIITEGTLVEKAVSDGDGRAYFKDLPPGKYIVRELSPPPGYMLNENFAPVITLSYEGNAVEYLTWTGVCMDSKGLSVEVDKDTIKRTSAAYVSLPGQAGYNNIGQVDERYKYDIDFRSTSGIWADEFVVDDPLENVFYGKVIVEELWTPVVWGDYDGHWNLWYATNKTDQFTLYSAVSAMDTNPYNPENPERLAVYPNIGLKLLASGLKANERYHFTLDDFGLSEGEYLTKLRFEYGRVEVGFTSKNYSDESLNGEHRKISGKDLRLPSHAANELMLLDARLFDEPRLFSDLNSVLIKESYGFVDYITGISGNTVDWTPIEGTRFYSEGAKNPGYDLLPASYLVSAVKPMEDIDIVSSVSARIARDLLMRAYDQDAVVTKEIGTFKYEDKAPRVDSAKTLDNYPLLIWLLVLLGSSIGLLLLGHYTIKTRKRVKRF